MLLYYITDRTQFTGDETARRRALLIKIAEAVACRVDYVQLREKDLSTREIQQLVEAATRIIREKSATVAASKTRLLINSRTDLAIACGADGVHLRSEDISPGEVRAVWELASVDRQPIVAISCHTAFDVARAASGGADFVVFAPIFEKKDAPRGQVAGLTALREACRQNIPVLALGGVNRDNAHLCMEAGASGIAGIRLFQEHDVAETVRLLQG